MSRTLLALIVGFVLIIGVAVWSLTRSHPSELEIAAKELPPLPDPVYAADDWPFWRGPKANGHSPDATAPISWSESENIVWKTPIPGRGHSSPIILGNKIFLTTADESRKEQKAICIDRTDGEIRWEKTVLDNSLPYKHSDNTHATSTPASDGERLFVAFADDEAVHLFALDLFTGEILWHCLAGPRPNTRTSHGFASSLALSGSFVIASDDSCPGGRGWIAAIHRHTGEIAWRKPRNTGVGSYGSPAVATLDGRPMIVISGNSTITAYDPQNGNIIWDHFGLADTTANTVAVSPTTVFGSSGNPQRKLLAVNANGGTAWTKEGGSYIPYPPSMLWADGNLFIVSDASLVSCLDAATGEMKWKERAQGSYYSSPLLVGKNLYMCNRDGLTTVFEANPEEYVEVKRNKLDGAINASPVCVGGKLYIRTDSHLYCIGK